MLKSINERYSRQIILPGFGEAAQQKLQQAKVCIVGMGALGCPALQYLTAAGVVNMGIIDGDVVQLHNLHRQPLFFSNEVGALKVMVAKQKMQQLNPLVNITDYPFHIHPKNALQILSEYDIVIDATDNFPTKYLLNDACAILQKPLVYGAVSQYEGQVSIFNNNLNGGKNIQYRDVFPDPAATANIQSCEQAGVLGVLPGIIGTLQATEVIKFITGMGQLLDGRLLTYRSLETQFYEIELTKNANTVNINVTEFQQTDYQHICNAASTEESLSVDQFKQMLQQQLLFVVDVREMGELPHVNFVDHQIPYSQIIQAKNNLHIPVTNKNICIICQQGIRSRNAATIFQSKTLQKIFHLQGGLNAYFNS
ncbi:HesA/MoeB/ThiF family protein [Hydrotalea sandarakina]|jgi:adenylyltransferase/sulfurtransferase|uniref:Molybdopterin-synthase adenylyltransferase n=1 Tax=Hydrotalea sandarakina TaxID=1004304 RepID=A0A2W7TA80_9BACT|nr:HesA/MoeB/ThiF family protein [Hydrotalea sandarakina]PZX60072.1 adenylyltransferase/sulfurtransferase [Hydrotalea sandarakina]